MDKQKVYFPNLNGLRFIAAMMVLFPHIEQMKPFLGYHNVLHIYPYETGKLGVVLFFVLSGFLITYLLLTEEKLAGVINIKKFYIRRILRIWPLYFFIVLLAFFILPNISIFIIDGYEKEVIQQQLPVKILLYAVFLPQFVGYLSGLIPYASHLWSVGTEEQFYLVWPVLVKYIKKHRIYLMFFVILFYLIIKLFVLPQLAGNIFLGYAIEKFWTSFMIDSMAIGGIYAILLFQKNKILAVIQNRYTFYLVLLLTMIMWLSGVKFPYIHFEIYSILFGLIIMNFASNDKIKISLENKLFTYMGNISYGLYMYHPIAIALALTIGFAMDIKSTWFVYSLSLLLTIIVAAISYSYFERYFISLKTKFSNVISGDEARKK